MDNKDKSSQNDASKVETKKEKTGGRKKGTPNKNSFLFRKALDDAGFNIVAEIIEQYEKLPEKEVQSKLAALKSLLPYLYPVLKEVEISGLPKSDPLEKQETGKSALLKSIKANL